MISFLNRIRTDRRGAAAVEFALIGPTMIAMMLGVLQIGIAMQSYNAMRSSSADIARYAAVQYQVSNQVAAATLATYGKSLATARPYNLNSANLLVTVTPVTTSRVTGAREFTITMNYAAPSVLAVVGIESIPLQFTRPIFVAQL